MKNSNCIYLKSSKAVIKVMAGKEVINDILNDDFLDAYIPSVKVLKSSTDYDATINFTKCDMNAIKNDNNNYKMFFNKENTKDFITFIEYVFERIRQEKGIICIHSSGAIVDDKLIVCWGTTTGIGKSTLAYELSKYGSYYSDEKILIDLKTSTCCGRIKKQYISNNELKKQFGDDYFYKNENISSKENYKIAMFIEPVICNQEEYIYDEWKVEKFKWHLYEESCRKIRGTTRVYFDGTYPAESYDDFSLAKNRLKLIESFVKKNKAVYYKGNTKNIIKMLKLKKED